MKLLNEELEKEVGCMLSDQQQRWLRALIQNGLPLISRPYQELADIIGVTEDQVRDSLASWQRTGLIKRLGIVVRHQELGYVANAMVVWNVPDSDVDRIGSLFKNESAVTLCYRRPRCLPDWPYNLFCMIHGKDRGWVYHQIETILTKHKLEHIPHEVLFSTKRFKQCGGQFVTAIRGHGLCRTELDHHSVTMDQHVAHGI